MYVSRIVCDFNNFIDLHGNKQKSQLANLTIISEQSLYVNNIN